MGARLGRCSTRTTGGGHDRALTRLGGHAGDSPGELTPLRAFVPDDFQPPHGLVADHFLLEPLGPQHNEADHEAWSSSIEHIRATPGFPDGRWPRPMTPEENRADLERHARDFAQRSGFTYTVLDPSDRDVIGCVYIYPDSNGADDAVVKSWVRATHARRDGALRELVARWLAEAWPFEQTSYARVSGEA